MSELNLLFHALRDPAQNVSGILTTWNGSDPGQRFAVHRNNIVVSLVDAVADTFPVCLALVGKDFFRAMAHAFILARPPMSPVLAWYGGAFPEFVSHFSPAAGLPYLADVARLEWAWVQAFHAADDFSLDAGAIDDLLTNEDILPYLEMRFHPSAHVICSRYAIVSIWSAHQGLRDMSTVAPEMAEAALIVRAGIEVECIPITAAQACLFDALCSGTRLGRAIEDTMSRHQDLDLPQALATLFSHPIITSITASQRKIGS